MIQTVTSFRSSDGKLHSTKREAEKHQAEIDFRAHYEKDGLNILIDDLLDYLRDNRKLVVSLLTGNSKNG